MNNNIENIIIKKFFLEKRMCGEIKEKPNYSELLEKQLLQFNESIELVKRNKDIQYINWLSLNGRKITKSQFDKVFFLNKGLSGSPIIGVSSENSIDTKL